MDNIDELSDSLKDQLKIDLQKLNATPRDHLTPPDTNASSRGDNSPLQMTRNKSLAQRVLVSLTLTTLVVCVLCAYLLYLLYESEWDTSTLSDLRYSENIQQFEHAFYRPLRDWIVDAWRNLVG